MLTDQRKDQRLRASRSPSQLKAAGLRVEAEPRQRKDRRQDPHGDHGEGPLHAGPRREGAASERGRRPASHRRRQGSDVGRRSSLLRRRKRSRARRCRRRRRPRLLRRKGCLMLTLPFQHELQQAKTVLLAGCGGGFDVFSGLPLFFALEAAGKTVHLANLTFSNIPPDAGRRLGRRWSRSRTTRTGARSTSRRSTCRRGSPNRGGTFPSGASSGTARPRRPRVPRTDRRAAAGHDRPRRRRHGQPDARR